MLINVKKPSDNTGIALFQLGFRPFFLGASLFSIFSMILWAGIYTFDWSLPLLQMHATTWHAHEMLFGYAVAVIAGFLLTAVKNWTGQQTLNGFALASLFTCWLCARMIPVLNIGSLELMALFDILFLFGLALSIALPVLRVRQWAQSGILLVIVLLLAANMTFYAGALGKINNGETIGMYSALYLILLLAFVMARRVVPFFIERSVVDEIKLRNRKWLDISSLIIFICLWVADIIMKNNQFSSILAGVLFSLHAIRLYDWYTKQLWASPMAWILYVGYAFFVVGFALKFLTLFLNISPLLSTHAFGFGGISVLTMGMMARVSLGHTGRNILQPPLGTSIAFILLVVGAITRVLLPIIAPSEYFLWIGISQLCWIIAFSIFFILFLPILIKSRIDGQPG